MSCIHAHGSDAVADSRNAKTPWAGTHGVNCVFTCHLTGIALTGTSETATPTRCMDGIGFPTDILRQP